MQRGPCDGVALDALRTPLRRQEQRSLKSTGARSIIGVTGPFLRSGQTRKVRCGFAQVRRCPATVMGFAPQSEHSPSPIPFVLGEDRDITMNYLRLSLATGFSLLSPAAFAGPYINAETNAGWLGNDYQEATTDLHLGYEGAIGKNTEWYVQGGPAAVTIDGANVEVALSGKAGMSANINESLELYGELSALTSKEGNLYFGKVGVKYKL